MARGGRAASQAAEGVIARLVKGVCKTADRPLARGAGGDAAKAAERQAARRAEHEAAGRAGRDARSNPAEHGRETDRATTAGDPVDVVTGKVLVTHLDVALPGVLPLVLRRTHLSSYRHGHAFGPNWASTLDVRLEVDDDGAALVGEDGSIRLYPYAPVPGQSVQPVAGPPRPLTVAGGRFAVTDPADGIALEFETGAGVRPLASIVHPAGDRIDVHRTDGQITDVVHSGGYRVSGLSLNRPGDSPQPLVRFGYTEARLLGDVINSSGRPLRFDYDDAGRMTRWTDRNGHFYDYRYDDYGRCVSSGGSAGHLTTRFEYDAATRTTTVVDALSGRSTYTHNELSQVIRQVDAAGGVITREWDAQGRLLSTTDPTGRTTRRTYDRHGNLIGVLTADGAEAMAAYTPEHQIASLTGSDGAIRTYTYDELGRRVAVGDPLGATTRYAYDAAGHLVSVTDPLGAVTTIEPDAAGLPLRVVDHLGGTTEYERDAAGRVIRLTDPLGQVTELAWTPDGRIASRTGPDGAAEAWTYDAEGNVAEHTGPSGAITRFEYTAFDRLIRRIDADGTRLEFTYDALLRVVAVTDQAGRSWTYDYDPAGRTIAETDFDGRTLRYAYDPAGRLAERVNALGQRQRFVRDAAGRIVSRIAEDGRVDYTYDPAGRLLTAVSDTAALARAYDRAGRLASETVDGRTIAYTYDPAGRRISRTTPGGTVSTWSYDERHAPVHLTVDGQAIDFSHDAAGRLRGAVSGTASLARDYDPAGRLIAQTVWAGTGDPHLVAHRGWSRRADGAIIGDIDTAGTTRQLHLDEVGRVTGVTVAETWTERYAYDATGNLTGEDIEYSGTRVRRSGRYRYDHDAQGRLVLRQRAQHSGKPLTWHYTWTAEDRLASVSTSDGVRWSYRYDPMGRRLAKYRIDADGSVAEQIDFVWDGNRLAEQAHHRPGTGPVVTTWDYRPGTWTPITQTERHWLAGAPQAEIDVRFHLIVADLNGAPTHLVTPGGKVAWQMSTTIWGTATAVSATGTDCPLRLPGQYHDPETGHHYNHQRYYDPATARYLSSDPLGLGPAPNPVAYVVNPTVDRDPLGLERCRENPEFDTRDEAEQAIFDKAGISRDTEPDFEWEVGDDVTRRNTDGYYYAEDRGSHGNYRQYETDEGSRVIVEHTNDPAAKYPHFHAGQPKADPSRTDVDFGWSGENGGGERYNQIAPKHHYYYKSDS